MRSTGSPRHLLSVDDLSDDDVRHVVGRALEIADGADVPPRRALVAELFFSSSLRTKLGFAAAAHRLGATPVVLDGLRHDPTMSAAESLDDTLRVAAGMADLLVVRADVDLASHLGPSLGCAVVSGGDAREHPTQALVDQVAITRFVGPVAGLHVALCGDLQMRSVVSWLALAARFPPARLVLASPPSRRASLPSALAPITDVVEPDDIGDVNIVMLPGLPARRGSDELDAAERAAYALDGVMLAGLGPSAVVLSPMPVIDEISPAARLDARVRIFEQSDLAVAVRVAVLELVLERKS